MGMQPLVPSTVPCPFPCIVCTAKGMYKSIDSGLGPVSVPVPAPVQFEWSISQSCEVLFTLSKRQDESESETDVNTVSRLLFCQGINYIRL